MCPVKRETGVWLLSPRRVVAALVHASDLDADAFGASRAVALPGMTVTVGEMVDALGLGLTHSCAVQQGQLFCWGANDVGQLGVGDTTARTAPEAVGTALDWEQVAGGEQHSCGIEQGRRQPIPDRQLRGPAVEQAQVGQGVGP